MFFLLQSNKKEKNMIKEYTFSGKGSWVSTKSHTFPNGDEVWSMSFYPRTAADRKEILATGIKNKPALDDDGLPFFKFRNKTGPYKILNPDGSELTALVGNGSDVDIKLVVETFHSQKFGPQARSTLTEVIVTGLVPYEKPAEATEELPA
jgi:hypothetical protein